MKSILMFCCLYGALALAVLFGADAPGEPQPPGDGLESLPVDTSAAPTGSVVSADEPLPSLESLP